MSSVGLHKSDLDDLAVTLKGVCGRVERDVMLAPFTWFRVGGPADIFANPQTEDELAALLSAIPENVPTTVLGVGSNVIIRDGGIRGVVIRLGRGFAAIDCDRETHEVTAGAAALDARVAQGAVKAGIAGLEFLRGIPGSIGGALTMNAGAYENDMSNQLVKAFGIDYSGKRHEFSPAELGYSYRHSNPPLPVIWTGALLRGTAGDGAQITARMDKIMAAREDSQPIRERTGGSTFKNPDLAESKGKKAWQLIDAAQCRGLRIRGAMVSTQHCNFLINTGDATAADLEELGETVRARVKEQSGVSLHWEIKRIGDAAIEGEG
ncbi:MAG: UDP-N-acetylmuramate dehydrogenase [Alphaproteobacteria bacterium]